MDVAPVFSLAMGVLGAFGKMRAADRQEGIAAQQEEAARRSQEIRERNALLIEAEGRETARRERKESEREQSLARAKSAASGVTGAGTPGLYLGEMKQTAKEELDWLDYSTRTRVAQEKLAGEHDLLVGQAGAAATRSGAKATRAGAWTGLMGSAQEFGSAYNWWQKP